MAARCLPFPFSAPFEKKETVSGIIGNTHGGTAMRNGASDKDIAARFRKTVAGKLPGHGINDPKFIQPQRPMSAIGG